MPGGSRSSRKWLADQTQPSGLDEHRQVLRQERQWARSHRKRLSQDARQHHQVLSQVREHAARDRRIHKTALGENRWLTALADMITARRAKKR